MSNQNENPTQSQNQSVLHPITNRRIKVGGQTGKSLTNAQRRMARPAPM